MINTNEYQVTYIYKPTHEVVTKTLHPISDTTDLYTITKALNDSEDIEKILSVKEVNPSGHYTVEYKGWIQDCFDSYDEAVKTMKTRIELCKKNDYKFNSWDWKIKYYPIEDE